MKMGKKVREYKSGDFIFAKVKGYPAWPARVQRPNGKKYFVYFYGTGETANLPPNMIFDYAENKDKFLTKTVKRRDFNDGVKQIEHDFANNVPLEEVIGVPIEVPAANDTVNESTANDTLDDTVADTTADETAGDTTLNATQANETVEDSDDTGALVIDEGKQKPNKKGKDVKLKETPAKPKEVKTPRGKAKKMDVDEEQEREDKKEEEIVSRSGRKIRPKRYADEQTEENATLPSPAPKKRRGASPVVDKDKAEPKEKVDKNIKHFNTVLPSELEGLKEPFKSDDADKENILIAYLPSAQYVGIKLFQSKPTSFKNEAARLQWDKQAATNALTLKAQLERGHITSQSVIAQLVVDLNLTDEEKATLDKERETEEKKSRVQFLKTEMKMIELDAQIKTCLCLEKAETELCLKSLDELMKLEVKPLMLLKHPTCLETIKRMRAYVGNTPSWELSESAALKFSKQAHRIRKQADTIYRNIKELFITPEGLSFWEYFTERVMQFKKATSKLNADELLEMVHEPIEMSVPTSHTMKAAVEAANEEEKKENETNSKANDNDNNDDEPVQKKEKKTPVKSKKNANSTPSKPPLKRQSSRKLLEDKEKDTEKEKPKENDTIPNDTNDSPTNDTSPDDTTTIDTNTDDSSLNNTNTNDTNDKDTNDTPNTEQIETPKESNENNSTVENSEPEPETPTTEVEIQKDKEEKVEDKKEDDKSVEKEVEKPVEKEKLEVGEPRAKRSRETKKTEAPPPRSPAKRKAKN